jgi:hypothetical protein
MLIGDYLPVILRIIMKHINKVSGKVYIVLYYRRMYFYTNSKKKRAITEMK